MRKIVFGFDVNVCGIGGLHDAQEFPDDVSDEELNDHAWEAALQSAESYGYYPESWRPQEGDEDYQEDDEDSDSYTEIDAWWENYVPEKHDMHKPGGGSWFD